MLKSPKWEIIILVISIVLVLCVIIDDIIKGIHTPLIFYFLIPLGILGYYLKKSHSEKK